MTWRMKLFLEASGFWRKGRKPVGWKVEREGSVQIQTKRQTSEDLEEWRVKSTPKGSNIWFQLLKSSAATVLEIKFQPGKFTTVKNCKYAHFTCSHNRQEEEPLCFEELEMPREFVRELQKKSQRYTSATCGEEITIPSRTPCS